MLYNSTVYYGLIALTGFRFLSNFKKVLINSISITLWLLTFLNSFYLVKKIDIKICVYLVITVYVFQSLISFICFYKSEGKKYRLLEFILFIVFLAYASRGYFAMAVSPIVFALAFLALYVQAYFHTDISGTNCIILGVQDLREILKLQVLRIRILDLMNNYKNNGNDRQNNTP